MTTKQLVARTVLVLLFSGVIGSITVMAVLNVEVRAMLLALLGVVALLATAFWAATNA